ncbi:MAG: hypothetical protein GX345_09175 [Clostridiales bacterium]|nr:hypothetical protein [Clostridiales bacterium]
MSRVHKIFQFLLAMILLLAFSLSAYATGVPQGDEFMHVDLKTDSDSTYPGAFVTVTLKITNNYNATALRFPILFSKDVFEIEEPMLNLQKHGQLSLVTGNVSANASGNSAFLPSGYSEDDYGVLLVQWIGTANAGLFGCFNRPEGDDSVSFRLKVKQSADGTGELLIPENSNLFYYQAMNDPADATTLYNMTAQTCSLTFSPASVDILEALPDLDAFPGSTTVVDRENGFIYGLEVGLLSLENFLIPLGNAELSYEKSGGAYFGTGSKVNVNYGNNLVRTYTVVIFGDVDGDGVVDANDASTIVDLENSLFNWQVGTDDCLFLAADLNGDGTIDTNDAGIIIDSENGVCQINQVTGQAI